MPAKPVQHIGAPTHPIYVVVNKRLSNTTKQRMTNKRWSGEPVLQHDDSQRPVNPSDNCERESHSLLDFDLFTRKLYTQCTQACFFTGLEVDISDDPEGETPGTRAKARARFQSPASYRQGTPARDEAIVVKHAFPYSKIWTHSKG